MAMDGLCHLSGLDSLDLSPLPKDFSRAKAPK